MKGLPVEQQTHVWIRGNFTGLAAAVICEEDESILVPNLEQHSTEGRAPFFETVAKPVAFGSCNPASVAA